MAILLPNYIFFLQALEAWREEKDNVAVGDATSHRLAVCNMDWDRLEANDIYGEFLWKLEWRS